MLSWNTRTVARFPEEPQTKFGGAAITDTNGEYVSSIETTCPSDAQDILAIAEAATYTDSTWARSVRPNSVETVENWRTASH